MLCVAKVTMSGGNSKYAINTPFIEPRIKPIAQEIIKNSGKLPGMLLLISIKSVA